MNTQTFEFGHSAQFAGGNSKRNGRRHWAAN
jgi:hypothetical protein